MARYNDESVIKKISGVCNGAIVKMLITTIAFSVACIIIKMNDFNYHINNLFMTICILGALVFPALSLFNIAFTLIESLLQIIVHKGEAMDEIINILESKFGLRKDESFIERVICRVPLLGPIYAKRNRQELEDIVKAILGKTFFSVLTMAICYVAFSAIIKPTLIKEATGHSTMSLFFEYISRLIGIIFRE